MGIGLGNNSGYSTLVLVVIIARMAAVATAGRFELRNELTGVEGQDRILEARCWSRDDKLGLVNIMPGESKSWAFQTVRFWPFAYTEFRCELGTTFGLTREQGVVVFEADNAFLMDCDKPKGEECVWVAKKDGLYLRTKVEWFHERLYTDVLKTTWAHKPYISSEE